MNNEQLAWIIKKESKNKKIPISIILEECGIRRSLIYDLEKRNWTPSAEVVEKLADYFNISVDYLLGRTDNPNINR